MRTFFTADLHHAHKNILRFTDRPWMTLEEMHDEIRDDWNAVVRPGDRVFVIGDVSFDYKGVEAERWVKSLNGQKFLVAGNHDHSDGVKASKHWTWVKDYAEIRIGKDRVILFHFPILSWYQMHRGSYHLHGHSHGNLRYPWKLRNARILDVGLDAVVSWVGTHRPVEWEEIKEHLKHRKSSSVDHHQIIDDLGGRFDKIVDKIVSWWAHRGK